MTDLNRFGATVKAFRGKAVIAQDDLATHTLNLELAAKVGAGFDWPNKITVQVSRVELPRFCAAVLGLRQQGDGKYHGPAKNKSWHLAWSSDGLGLKLSDAGDWRTILFNDDELFWLGSLCVEQLGKNTGAATHTDTLNLLKLSCRSRG